MAPSAIDNQHPKPSRIVINFERARQMVHAPKRGSRGAKILGVIALLLGLVVIVALVGGYFWWQSYKSKPAYSLALLVDAVERNDTKTIDADCRHEQDRRQFCPASDRESFWPLR